MYRSVIVLIIVSLGSMLYASNKPNTLQTVSCVELERYMGHWYQIAYFPSRFQPSGCKVVTSEYALNDEGIINVTNTCWDDYEKSVKRRQLTGKATVVSDSNAKFKIRFSRWLPFRADYWIINLDKEEYQYAVVSEPRRKYLWILSRVGTMREDLFKELVDDLKERGFDIDNLKITAEIN